MNANRRNGERGFAVIVSMMGLLLMSALGMALALSTTIETLISRHFRDGAGAAYAAEALALHAIQELSSLSDWTLALDGSVHSQLFDGGGTSVRSLADGSVIDLDAVRNLANCGTAASCSEADLVRADEERPWGLSNPRWRLFASGRLEDLLGVPSPFYVVLFVADDPAETDLNPFADGAEAANPGSGVLRLRAEAFGPGGVHSAAEATISRSGTAELPAAPGSAPVRIVSWRTSR
jgi:hypothetical protein